MDITQENLLNLTTLYGAQFQNGFQGAESMHDLVASTVPSTGARNKYPFLGQMPGIREWIGERFVHKLGKKEYDILNKSYELTIEVDRDDIEDDTFGVYNPMFQNMGYEVRVFPSELVYGLLINGFTTESYDGQYFFDTDHPGFDENGNEISVSNMQAGGGNPWFLIDDRRPLKPMIYQLRRDFQFVSRDNLDDPKVFDQKVFTYGVDGRMNAGFGFWHTAFGSQAALDETNLDTGIDSMGGLKKMSGAPMAISPNKLVVGTSNRKAALEVVKKERKAGGETNVNMDAVEVVVVPWLP